MYFFFKYIVFKKISFNNDYIFYKNIYLYFLESMYFIEKQWDLKIFLFFMEEHLKMKNIYFYESNVFFNKKNIFLITVIFLIKIYPYIKSISFSENIYFIFFYNF